jgi:hypothetical protein
VGTPLNSRQAVLGSNEIIFKYLPISIFEHSRRILSATIDGDVNESAVKGAAPIDAV